MNTRPCAISVRYRSYTYSPYISKEENAIQNNIVSSRYNVVLYGFKVNMDMTANMSHMFLNIIQMKRNIRHTWIDSAGQPQFILISENNRPVPPNLFSSLLWSPETQVLVSESAKPILGNQCRKRATRVETPDQKIEDFQEGGSLTEQPKTPPKGVSGYEPKTHIQSCSIRFPTKIEM